MFLKEICIFYENSPFVFFTLYIARGRFFCLTFWCMKGELRLLGGEAASFRMGDAAYAV